jgi:hypothetical protein
MDTQILHFHNSYVLTYIHTYIHTYYIRSRYLLHNPLGPEGLGSKREWVHKYCTFTIHTCLHAYIHKYIHTYIRSRYLLHNPLGPEGLGSKRVWRFRGSDGVWRELIGDKSATEVCAIFNAYVCL